ncbi:unnamed protein product [Phytophthora lilii]|uniref:Unnamed protein product n=1 Tax=Phytophthora lilii TaxID=2077276 RepID=A0A9W6UE45_9STRA|nr:unnamed protein product [Phytophthora lilii]
MTHHLVVYVCQLTGTRSQQGEVDAAVLARHESPGFSLISYRRSGNNSRDAGCDLPAVELSSDTAFASVEINHSAIRSEDMDIDSYDQASSNMSRAQEGHHFNAQDQAYEEQWQPQHRQQQQQREHGPKVPEEWNEDWKWREQNPSRHPAFRYRSSYASQAMKEDFQEEDAMNDIEFRATVDIEVDDVLWQKDADIREPGFREKTQHLVILWRFLQHVSLSNLKISVDTMEAHVHSHWLRAAAALRAPVISFSAQLEGIVASFLSNIFSSANRATQAPLTDADAHSAHDQATIRASVYLFLRALSSRNVQHLLREACRIGSGEMNKSWLQERFISLVLDLYDILGDVLREVSVGARANAPEVLRSRRDVTLPALVDNVLSLIYGRTHFSVLRDDVSSLLLNRQTSSSLSDAVNHAFRAFVVQAHEASVAAVAHARPDARQQQLWGESSNAWSRRWLLDPGSVQLNALDHNTKRDVRCGAAVIAVAQLVRELGCIDIVVSKGSMSLRTALSFDGIMAMAPMELVLDGRLRGFRVLPSGISSMFAAAGRWFVGDYEAVLSDDGQSVNLNFFAFVEEKTAADARRGHEGGGASATVRRVSLSLILEQDFDDKGPATSTQPRDLFIVVHGTVLGSTYTPTSASAGFSAPRRMLSTMSSADRVLVWNELRWTPLFEVQAGYVAL